MNLFSKNCGILLNGLGVALLSACSGGGSINLGSGQTADPGTDDFPIAYVKRTVPTMGDDLRELRDATPDADLWIRDRASPSAAERNITERVTGTTDRYDIRDLNVSADGRKFVFAMRGPLAMNQDEIDTPNWAVWEYDLPSDTLRRVITSNTIAAEGQDVGPSYLPDGRIVFSSTRQRQSQAILRDEGKPGYEAQTDEGNESAFVLHAMKADGTDLKQISYNQSHDLNPTVLADGRVLWSRWDGATGRGFHLYRANPDGTQLQLLYGARSHETGTQGSTIQFTKPREMQDGRVMTLTRPFEDSEFGGDLTIIDTRTYVENTQAVRTSAGLPGPAQSRATTNNVSTLPGPSIGGRFVSGYPLWDGTQRILVSWSQCRLLEAGVIVPCTPERMAANPVTAPPLYSAFMFNPTDNTFKPLFQPIEGVMITDLIAAQPRALPAVILDRVPVLDFDAQLSTDGVGILDIRSVYDFAGTDGAAPDAPNIATLADHRARTANQRRARFLRIEKVVPLGDDDLGFPDLDGAAFGTVNFMREILGYAPIEPDGSVRVRVPSNVAFLISVLDRDGRRISTPHRNWLQLRPGETRACNGCHRANAGSHGRDDAFASAWPGATTAGQVWPGTQARFSANPGETMAQTRARWSCANANCAAERLSVNLNYVDEWTDPTAAGRPADTAFSYTYGGATGLTTAAPTSAACVTTWQATCRIIINYVAHIHPLWFVDRGANTCTNCHTPRDAANMARVPAGQLDLSDGDSNEQALHKQAYRELLFSDNQQEVNMGVVQDTVVISIDPRTGQQVTSFINVASALNAGSARGSPAFFSRFAAAGSHAGYLTAAELRLLSEWVDIGAQYFNNPFDPAAPVN